MAWKNNKPPSGPGWGGAPKGAGSGGAREEFKAGNRAAAKENRTGGTSYRRLAKEERLNQMYDVVYGIALDGESDNARLIAARYLIDREEGAIPPAKTDQANGDEIVIKGGLPDGD